ncbi:hypothetical protein FOMPIDRAFT_1055265 [Fomitopsis schrenkii]|uniref:Uncharacterized protein n=1 Tax=Fomitopsis schrenkii TaxID=2126942 RepID=S8F5S5_FOMSC|nr:hypothetical protein FOMPIDRAFT_1055265 [Fomitopsis schrenkii]
MNDPANPTFASLLRSTQVNNSGLVAAYAALLYDRCLIAGQEALVQTVLYAAPLTLRTAGIAATASVLVADLIVIVVTWRKTYQSLRLSREAGISRSMPLSTLLLRNGSTIYYV